MQPSVLEAVINRKITNALLVYAPRAGPITSRQTQQEGRLVAQCAPLILQMFLRKEREKNMENGTLANRHTL